MWRRISADLGSAAPPHKTRVTQLSPAVTRPPPTALCNQGPVSRLRRGKYLVTAASTVCIKHLFPIFCPLRIVKASRCQCHQVFRPDLSIKIAHPVTRTPHPAPRTRSPINDLFPRHVNDSQLKSHFCLGSVRNKANFRLVWQKSSQLAGPAGNIGRKLLLSIK